MSDFRFYAKINGDFTIYRDNRPFMRAVRNSGWFFNTNVKVYLINDDRLVLEYKYFEFFITKVKIMYQNLPKAVSLKRKNIFSYCLKVDDITICNKFKNMFSKHFGDAYIKNERFAAIKKKKAIMSMDNDIRLEFIKNTEYELYCIMALLINITAIDDAH